MQHKRDTKVRFLRKARGPNVLATTTVMALQYVARPNLQTWFRSAHTVARSYLAYRAECNDGYFAFLGPVSLSRTPRPPAFSSMNSTPAFKAVNP